MVPQIEAPRVEFINIDTVLDNEGFQPAGQAVLTGQVVVIVEVIDGLSLPDVAEIDVAGLGGPLHIVELRIDVLIFKPPLICKRLPQLVVTSFHDEHLLVEAAPVFALPGRHIHIFLFVLLVLLFLSAVHIDVIPVLDLGLLGKVDGGQWLGLVLEAAHLLVGHVVELDPAPILALAVQQFQEGLLDLVGFHRHDGFETFALEQIEIILPPVEECHEGDELVPEVVLDVLILDDFGLDVDLVLGHEGLLGDGAERSLHIFPFGEFNIFDSFETVLADHLVFAVLHLESLDEAVELGLVGIIDVFYIAIALDDLFERFGNGGRLQVVLEQRMQRNGILRQTLFSQAVSNPMLIHQVDKIIYKGLPRGVLFDDNRSLGWGI